MSKQPNLQDHYLNVVRKNKTPLTVILTNGFQLRGTLIAFDNFTILLNSEGKEQLIYKHAISTYVPKENIDLSE